MDFGFLSILPPIIAIVLALLTKEVISSLLIGILAGTLIYSRGNVVGMVTEAFSIMADTMGDNISIILFLALLGALVVIVTKAGGSSAYGEWAAKKMRSRTGALLATSALGALIFIDDYFNCLTVGTVMRPVTDKHKVSRVKLAYIIDATAAPVCIIAPISSWAAAVGSQMEEAGLANGMNAFIRTIPYNLYAILTIIMLVYLSIRQKDFFSMRRYEREAMEGNLHATGADVTTEQFSGMKISRKGRVCDLVIPIVALIIFSVLAMLLVGGYFDGSGKSIGQAFGDTDAAPALVLGGFCALIVTFILYMPRKILSFKEFTDGITEGVKSMVPAFIILTLAWTISEICRNYLLTGEYVSNLVLNSVLPVQLLPAIVFLVACFLGFSMGTSWGTFGILIPIVVPIFAASSTALSQELMYITLAATLAGAVYGDHCSPISDTTILSSTGAGCDHIAHVSTQLPYASLVAVCCLVSYLVAGFAVNVWITLAVSIVLLMGSLLVLGKLYEKK